MAQSETQVRRVSDPETDKLRELVRQAELAGLPDGGMAGRADDRVDGIASAGVSPAAGEGRSAVVDRIAADPTGYDSDKMEFDASVQQEVLYLGKRSLEKVEQLHLQNLQLISERDSLVKKLEQTRQRASEYEELNLQLDQQVAKLEAERMQILEMQQRLDRREVTITGLREEILRLQKAMNEQQQRSLEVQRQLRAINQERSARVASIKSKLQSTMHTNVELERQVEDLVGYRQRAAESIGQLNSDLKRALRDNRVKARRLAEARSLLRDIEHRLGSELG